LFLRVQWPSPMGVSSGLVLHPTCRLPMLIGQPAIWAGGW